MSVCASAEAGSSTSVVHRRRAPRPIADGSEGLLWQPFCGTLTAAAGRARAEALPGVRSHSPTRPTCAGQRQKREHAPQSCGVRVPSVFAWTQRRNFLAAREPAAAPEIQRTRPPQSLLKARCLAPQEPAKIMKLLFLPTLALAGTFVDDTGVSHTTTKAAPTIIAAVGDALSLAPVRKSSRPRRPCVVNT